MTRRDEHNTKPKPAAVDPFSYLGMTFIADGSIRREHGILATPTSFDPALYPVFTHDVTFNQSNNIGARLYLHRKALGSNSNKPLPIFIYFHGGGFIIGGPSSPVYHDFCAFMAVDIPALIVSVDYRLGPEHRLPAAYHDCMEALQWIKNTPHEWLHKYGDLSKCYIMGSSAGGNIAYHAASFLKDVDLAPLKIEGLLLIQPFFGGTQRTESEQRLANDKVLPLNVNDIMWELGLPLAVDRNHEYCNPMVEGALGACDEIKNMGWRVMMKGCDGDPLIDRQMEVVKMMREREIDVVSKFDEGDFHAIEVLDPSKAKALFVEIKHFISSTCSSSL